MKIRKNKQSNRKKITVILLLLLAIAAGLAYFVWSRQGSSTPTDTPKSTQETSTENSSSATDAKKQSTDKATSNTSQQAPQSPKEKEKDTKPPYEGSNPDAAESLSGVITYSAVSEDTLIIRTNINQSVGSGSCELTLTQNSKTVTKTSSIAPNPSSSTCQGFDIPVSELGSGTWSISIKLSGDGKAGTLSGNVTI